jgi:hypothetical protein
MGRKLNAQARSAMFFMRERRTAGLREFERLGVRISEAELEDLVDAGYMTVVGRASSGNREWTLTKKGREWVDRNLP